MIDIVKTSGEVKPYLDVAVPKGWWAFEHLERSDSGWSSSVVQIVSDDGAFYRNVAWTRAQEHVSTRNHIASVLALAIIDYTIPGLKMNARVVAARKIRNV